MTSAAFERFLSRRDDAAAVIHPAAPESKEVKMRKALWLVVLVVLLTAGALPGTAGTATGTFVTLDSKPGDPLGGGIQQTFTRRTPPSGRRATGRTRSST